MILFVLFWGFVGFSLEVDLALGWAGRPVLDAVNPLWVTLTNTEPTVISGELRVSGTFGSPWRGQARYTAIIPFSLGAFSKARFLLPWPVQVGTFAVTAAVYVGAQKIAEKEVRFSPEPGPMRAGIGPPSEPVDFFLSPAELPPDPLFLSPCADLLIFSPLSANEADVVRAWQTFFGKEGIRLEPEAIRARLTALRPPSPRWWAIVPGLFVYLLAMNFALPRLSRGRPGLVLFSLALFLVLSGFYAVFHESPAHHGAVYISVGKPGFTSFYTEFLGLMPWVAEKRALEGWWVEVLPQKEWQGRDLTWRFSDGEWFTEINLAPAVPRIFFRVTQKRTANIGEPITPPNWLSRALSIPWEKAEITTVLTEETVQEAYLILLP